MITPHTIGGYRVNVMRGLRFYLNEAMVTQLTTLVNQASGRFAVEQTAVSQRFGHPSLFSRLDFTVVGSDGETITIPDQASGFEVNGTVAPYGWNERPGGLGIGWEVSRGFALRLADELVYWPKLWVALDPARQNNDDRVWLGEGRVIRGPAVPDDDRLVIVRADPGQAAYDALASRAAAPVTTKGNREYGERLSWWKWVSSPDELPAGQTLVLKPRQSSSAHGLLICPSRRKEQQRSMVTRARLERTLEESAEGMYLQPWYSPLRWNRMNVVLRVFYGLCLSDENPRWVPLGGYWIARRSAIVIGTHESVVSEIDLL